MVEYDPRVFSIFFPPHRNPTSPDCPSNAETTGLSIKHRHTTLRNKAPFCSSQSVRAPYLDKRSKFQCSSKLTHHDLRPWGSGTSGPPICHFHSWWAGRCFLSPWRWIWESGPKSPSSFTTGAGGQVKQSRRLKVVEAGGVVLNLECSWWSRSPDTKFSSGIPCDWNVPFGDHCAHPAVRLPSKACAWVPRTQRGQAFHPMQPLSPA